MEKNRTVNYSKKFSALLVSEDTSLLEEYFQEMFKDFFVCNNQADALKVYEKNSIDIVVIDTDTKEINWLSLVNKLRQKIYDLPIAILTDLDNPNRLTAAITIGINQCIFKPIEQEKLNLAIEDIASKLQNKIDAKELFYRKEQEQINQVASDITEKIIKDIPYPMFVFKNEKVFFANRSLYKLFENKRISIQEIKSIKEIENLFENITQVATLEELKFGKNFDVKYNYQDYSLKKVFVPTKYTILLDSIEEEYDVIILDDIAPLLMQIKMLHYQQNKVNNYKTLIEELLAKHIFKDNKKSIRHIDKSIDDTLSDGETQILRKDIQREISSKEYLTDLDESSYEEVQELKEVEEDIRIVIYNFQSSGAKKDLFEIARLFSVQGNVVRALMEFIDLGNAICSLSDFLYGLEEDKIEKNMEIMGVQFESILEDLIQWRENIFETQSTIDIHYLDSSIFSSILQLQLNLDNDAQSQDEDDDFELF